MDYVLQSGFPGMIQKSEQDGQCGKVELSHAAAAILPT